MAFDVKAIVTDGFTRAAGGYSISGIIIWGFLMDLEDVTPGRLLKKLVATVLNRKRRR